VERRILDRFLILALASHLFSKSEPFYLESRRIVGRPNNGFVSTMLENEPIPSCDDPEKLASADTQIRRQMA
jgi:hypothetical protein